MGPKDKLSKRIGTIVEKIESIRWNNWKNDCEQVISGDKVPELKELLQEIGGKVTHGDWEYSYYEAPLNIVVRTKTKIANCGS